MLEERETEREKRGRRSNDKSDHQWRRGLYISISNLCIHAANTPDTETDTDTDTDTDASKSYHEPMILIHAIFLYSYRHANEQ
jgi:hypothetical protein